MLTLAFDTAATAVSVALLNGQNVVAADGRNMERGQGEALIPMVDALLKQAGLSPADVKRVAVSVGPGSFTGVRVGLAAARGMGLALHVPVVGITTLAAAAYQVPAETVLAVADTKRGDFFTQLFRGGRATEDPTVRTADQIRDMGPICLTGMGADKVADYTGQPVVQNGLWPAVAVGLLAQTGGLPPNPMYLRDADVSL